MTLTIFLTAVISFYFGILIGIQANKPGEPVATEKPQRITPPADATRWESSIDEEPYMERMRRERG